MDMCTLKVFFPLGREENVMRKQKKSGSFGFVLFYFVFEAAEQSSPRTSAKDNRKVRLGGPAFTGHLERLAFFEPRFQPHGDDSAPGAS